MPTAHASDLRPFFMEFDAKTPVAQFNNNSMRAKARKHRLPNGLVVQSLSAIDSDLVYHEVFVEDVYRQHAVTINSGDCIVDIGANTGLFELFLDEICPTATVFACEPLPLTFAVLDANLRKLRQLKVTAINIGIGAEEATRSFAFYPRLSCASTMYPDLSSEEVLRGRNYVLQQFRQHPNRILRRTLSFLPNFLRMRLAETIRQFYAAHQMVECRLRTLASLIDEHSIDRIDLLKIDAERSEREILHGIRGSDWSKIRQIVVEVHEGETSRLEVERLLVSHGFKVVYDCNPHFPNIFMLYAIRR